MKYVESPANIQGSPEWHALRRIKIGASNSPALLGLSPYKTSADVFREMAFGERPYINKSMQHGSDTESEALEYFNANLPKYNSKFHPAVIISEENPILMASLDGINESETLILEIKCPGEKVYNLCVQEKVPIYWEYQIQHQLAVSNLDSAILFVYLAPSSNLVFRYERDEKRIGEIVNVCKEFHENNLLTYICPESKEDSYASRSDEEWENTVTSYLQFKKQRMALEETEKLFHQKLIDLSADVPTKGCGIRVEKREVKGQIDYSLVEELQDMNLDQYRKPSKTQWRICEIRN